MLVYFHNLSKNILLSTVRFKDLCIISSKTYFESHFRQMDSLIAVAQLNSKSDKKSNLETCKKLISKASKRGAKMIFFPEGCDYLAESKKESIQMAESITGSTVNFYCKLSALHKIWLSIGGVHIKEDGEDKLRNTHIIINKYGNVVAKYSKSHMFNVRIPERNLNLQESTYVQEGHSIPSPVVTPCGLVAMGICYDMRFPEFSLLQRKMGAQVLTFPSAFTVHTGLSHWHSLLKARAIETQCYVIAAAQTGQHNSKRSSYGHALIIDPWGAVVAEASEGIGLAYANINFNYLEKIRSEMPVFQHRRSDLYFLNEVESNGNLRLTEILPFPKSHISYKFGNVYVPGDCIFLKTLKSQAFTNKKPFAPGHIIVTPEKPSKRYIDLTDAEVCDLAQIVVLSIKVLKFHSPGDKIQFAIQDGRHAGQTIEHVHAHLMPVKESLLKEGYEDKTESKWRDEAHMKEESFNLRHLVCEIQNNDLWLQSSDIPRTLRIKNPLHKKRFVNGENSVPHERIILSTKMSFAYLPTNPVLPGHILICPHRRVSSLIDLSPNEVTDLFLSIQRIQKYLESYYGTFSSTIFAIDRNSKQQQNSDLTAHVVARNENDLKNNDDIYSLLQSHQQNCDQDNEDNYDQDLIMFMRKNILF